MHSDQRHAGAAHIKITVDSGVLFTNAPYKYVLQPSEVAELSNMSHYVGKAVSVALHGGAHGVGALRDSHDGESTVVYVGTVASGADNVGVLTGERIAGGVADILPGEEIDCVLDEVQDVTGLSAVGFGECSFSGDGRIDIAFDTARIFSGAGQIAPTNITNLGVFKGLNAGTYDKSGEYEVFTITGANATHMAGTTYFSTRLETWGTDFAAGEAHVEECSVFIDKKSGGAVPLLWSRSKSYF